MMIINSLHYLFVLLGALSFLAPVLGQDPSSGFISIDCGLPENIRYIDKNTGINYISDVKFIDSGVSKSVSPQDKNTHQPQFNYLRSFPNGVRNCYKINVTSGADYLIRASFLYGNYDGLNKLPQFELHLGPNVWETVKFTNSSISVNYEIIHSPPQNHIHLCLANTDNGTPFISVIELRPLPNDTYSISIKSVGSLARLVRLDLGSITNLCIRYKDDLYDRLWEPYSDSEWTQLSTSLNTDELNNSVASTPPVIVMSTAATPINSNASLDFTWDADTVTDSFHICMHFNEIQKLKANEARLFNITLNGKLFYGPFAPIYRKTDTLCTTSPFDGFTTYQLSILRTEFSTLPPIINGIEIYSVRNLSHLETEKDDADAITNIKVAYRVTRNWLGDPCCPEAFKWDGLDCNSIDGDGTPRITSLNLSTSGLTGHIIPDFLKLTMLKTLDLSNNNLTGDVPYFLAQLQSLQKLNLENNNLSGSIPNELLQKQRDGILSLSVGQNPNLCASTSCNPQTNDKRKKKSNAVIIVVALMAGMLLLLVIAAVIIFRQRKPNDAAKNIILGKPGNSINGSQLGSKQRQYSFNEVVKMTSSFDRVLGRGGFGTVYYGSIEDTQLAVKMLSLSSVQGYQQFVAEASVNLLMRVHHRNLTSLIGYCNEETNIGLIYEYMKNGNLDEHLSGENNRKKSLNWKDRLQIALDAAQGLEYLHNGCKPPIIHRDIKCTNILLDENFHAKLADFGLSKCFAADGDTHVWTIAAGTPGYLDPEYTISNILTEKSDVYSFGVVLLRIITGQPVIIRMEDTTHHISQRVNSMVAEGDITKIVDSRLQGDFDNNSAWRTVEIAMASVSSISVERPYMSDIVKELKECLAVELTQKHNSCDFQNEDLIGQVSLNLISTDINPIVR
ncbi:hypothetical protein Ahy_A09g046375 [Arachis hypogaea]|uniref:non-specific serine/threonine protein kinase n=1 Tax=Arachis hypogaea TaxID=3818 RepID=A0A445BPL2_ARAHY|nr:hypothetical protein Ahy_A09g046375 [Arachis hypogaea]